MVLSFAAIVFWSAQHGFVRRARQASNPQAA